MTTADSPLFVDTNILVYTSDTLSPWHERERNRLQAARSQGDQPVISPQILREYLATATRSVVGAPAPMPQILPNVENFRRTLLAHGIRRLLTNNEAHFNRFSAWITVVPLTQPT